MINPLLRANTPTEAFKYLEYSAREPRLVAAAGLIACLKTTDHKAFQGITSPVLQAKDLLHFALVGRAHAWQYPRPGTSDSVMWGFLSSTPPIGMSHEQPVNFSLATLFAIDSEGIAKQPPKRTCVLRRHDDNETLTSFTVSSPTPNNPTRYAMRILDGLEHEEVITQLMDAEKIEQDRLATKPLPADQPRPITPLPPYIAACYARA